MENFTPSLAIGGHEWLDDLSTGSALLPPGGTKRYIIEMPLTGVPVKMFVFMAGCDDPTQYSDRVETATASTSGSGL
jgi:hypothetical protein